MRKKAVWALSVLLGLPLAAGAAFLFSLWRALPGDEALHLLPGLRQPVRLRLDSDGVPHLDLAEENDGLRLLGYWHARDRLLQVGQLRRLAAGRISEWVGAAALPYDRFYRLYQEGLDEWERQLDPDSREKLDAYLEGFNAVLGDRRARPPLSRWVFGEERLTRRDLLSLMRFQSANLSSAWGRDLMRGLLMAEPGGAKQVATYLPWQPAFRRPLLPEPSTPPLYLWPAQPASFFQPLRGLVGDLPPLPTRSDGSNAWAVAPGRSASGGAILANDPHLFQTLPGLWYVVHWRHPEYEVYGVTFPGIPLIVIGRNRHLAWGATMSFLDVEDLVLLSPSEAAALPGREEVFRPRGAAAETRRLRRSPFGPVISDLWFDRPAPQGAALALQWPGFTLRDFPFFRAYAQIYRARNFAEFERGVRQLPIPSQVWTVASDSGEIGFTVNGAIPDRRGHSGLFPIDAATARREMEGGKLRLIPAAELPRRPPGREAILIPSNQALLFRAPRYTSLDYRSAARAERIRALLLASPLLTQKRMLEIQHDTYAAWAREGMERLCARPALRRQLAASGALPLCDFDGRFDAASRLAPQVAALWRGLIPAHEKGIDSAKVRELLDGDELLLRLIVERVGADATFPAADDLAAALRELGRWRAKHGEITWGEAHLLPRQNRLAFFWPLTALYNLPPLPVGGAVEAPWQEKYANRGDLFEVNGGASMHWVVDFGADNHGSLSTAAGNSENPLSPYYGNYWDSWKSGALRPIRWTEAEIEANKVADTLFRSPPEVKP